MAAEIIIKEKFPQNSATDFWNTVNLLRKWLNPYELPPGKVGLSPSKEIFLFSSVKVL